MKPQWLFGAPASRQRFVDVDDREQWSVAISGVHVLSVSDVDDIIAASARYLGVTLTPTRGQTGGGPGFPMNTHEELALHGASDIDFSRVLLERTEMVPGEGDVAVTCYVGAKLDAKFQVERWPQRGDSTAGQAPASSGGQERFVAYVEEILNSSRRRVPRGTWSKLIGRAAAVLIAAIWAMFAVSVWPNLWALAVGGFACAAFGIWLVPHVRNLIVRGSMGQADGIVVIDGTPRERIRADRMNSRQDLKVGAATALVTVVLTLVAGLVTGILGFE